MNTLASLSALAVAFALSATPAATQEKPEPVRVRVNNNNWLDARLYLDEGGALTPVGFIVAQESAEFTLPRRVLTTGSPVRLVVRTIGSRQAYASQTLLVGPGDALLLDLQNQIGLSATSVLPIP